MQCILAQSLVRTGFVSYAEKSAREVLKIPCSIILRFSQATNRRTTRLDRVVKEDSEGRVASLSVRTDLRFLLVLCFCF